MSITIKPIKSKEEIDHSIKEFKKQLLIEKSPPIVDRSNGWSPYKIIDFYKGLKIKMGHYKNSLNKEWFASSNYIELEFDDLIQNNISFYINGNSKVANQLKISLNVNNMDNSSRDIEKLIMYAERLTKFSTGLNLDEVFKKKLKLKSNYLHNNDIYLFKVFKDNHLSGNGYNLTYSIEIIN